MFTNHENSKRFQKELTMQNTNISILLPPKLSRSVIRLDFVGSKFVSSINNAWYTILNVVSCVADYMEFTSRHLFQRIEEHRRASSSITKHLKTVHRDDVEFSNLNFRILRKCGNEFESDSSCRVYIVPDSHSHDIKFSV